MQTRADLYEYLDYHAYEAETGRAVRRGEGQMTDMPMDDPRDQQDRRNRVALSRRRPPATPRCAPSAAPATTCITAATTFSISPTRCEFEEIAYLLVHEKLPTSRRVGGLQDAS